MKEVRDDTVLLVSAPKPHPNFDEYLLSISPEEGVLKIVAIGRSIHTNGFGIEVHDVFIEIRDTVSKTYGRPKTYDFLSDGSIWGERQDWMMGLLKRERTLASYWNLKSTLPKSVAMIVLEAFALSNEEGYLSLGYEFDGWEKYIDSKKEQAGTVF